MQDCFEKKDIPMLQEVIVKMPKEEAEYHMKRCVDSGLWVPGGGEDAAAAEDKKEATKDAESAKASDDEVYEEIDDGTALD